MSSDLTFKRNSSVTLKQIEGAPISKMRSKWDKINTDYNLLEICNAGQT